MRAVPSIPSFGLYGERPLRAEPGDCVHVESIQSRSSKYLWRIGTHRHTLLSQLLWVGRGPVDAKLDETGIALEGPAIMVIPAGTVHSFRFCAETQGFVISFDLARLLGPTLPAQRAPIEALYTVPQALDLRGDAERAGRLEQLIALLVHEFLQPGGSQAPVCGWLCSSVLWLAAAAARARAVASPVAAAAAPPAAEAGDVERLKAFRALIESHGLEHWPVSRYARRLALSETSLNRLCRRLAGATAFDLIQERLALEARRRLLYAGSAIHGVAAELGFKDPAYFSRFFRRQSGVSPQEFRRRHRGA